jgi:cellulose synthase/poly-beta-1,6-N-acetylglucosamine synthase-like glycosyltransferase
MLVSVDNLLYRNLAHTSPVTYFTNLVYLLIRFSVGNGDCAPFVGHNAFLRWKAIQSVSFMENDIEKFWSESHVSEDFDMSLRLQTAGFVVRLATYGMFLSKYFLPCRV